jgi:hypothetical protein
MPVAMNPVSASLLILSSITESERLPLNLFVFSREWQNEKSFVVSLMESFCNSSSRKVTVWLFRFSQHLLIKGISVSKNQTQNEILDQKTCNTVNQKIPEPEF